MGIHIERALHLRDRLQSEIGGILNRAIDLKMTSDDISDMLVSRVLQSPEYALMPEWSRQYLQGYLSARREEIDRHHLAYMVWLDGKLVTKQEVDTATRDEQEMGDHHNLGYKRPWQRVESDKGRFVWIDAQGKPMPDKPYSRRWVERAQS